MEIISGRNVRDKLFWYELARFLQSCMLWLSKKRIWHFYVLRGNTWKA